MSELPKSEYVGLNEAVLILADQLGSAETAKQWIVAHAGAGRLRATGFKDGAIVLIESANWSALIVDWKLEALRLNGPLRYERPYDGVMNRPPSPFVRVHNDAARRVIYAHVQLPRAALTVVTSMEASGTPPVMNGRPRNTAVKTALVQEAIDSIWGGSVPQMPSIERENRIIAWAKENGRGVMSAKTIQRFFSSQTSRDI